MRRGISCRGWRILAHHLNGSDFEGLVRGPMSDSGIDWLKQEHNRIIKFVPPRSMTLLLYAEIEHEYECRSCVTAMVSQLGILLTEVPNYLEYTSTCGASFESQQQRVFATISSHTCL